MSVLARFDESVQRHAVGALADIDALPVVLTRAAVDVLAVDGASLSLLSESVRMPLGAAGPASVVAEQLQFTLGEGPCLEVYTTHRARSYDAAQIGVNWPVYAGELSSTTPFRSCSSSPIDLGDSLMAALDLYSVSSEATTDAEMADVAVVAEQVQRRLRHHASAANFDAGPQWLRSASMQRRANVWIALALAAVSSDLDSVAALAVLRASAFGSGITIDELVRRLAARELDIGTVLGASARPRPPSPRGGELGHGGV